jgi:hypothetical protein
MREQPQASPARSALAGSPQRFGIPPGPGGPDGSRRRNAARPLPDPVAIRLCRVPDVAPPYDGDRPGSAGPARAEALAAAITAALQGGRADSETSARRPDGPRARSGHPRRPAGGADGADRADRAWRDTSATSGPGAWPSKFAQVLAETLAGSRPPGQISPWTTDRARSHIRRLGPMLTAGQQPVVQRIVTSRPADDVMEMSVVVGFGPRVRAVAIRLERTGAGPAMPGQATARPRWVCTAVEAA